MSFAGKTAVVTGAAGGMGLNIARDLAAAGASVIGIDLQEQPSGFADWVQGDVGDEATLACVMTGTSARDGLDYLVNAAGVLWFGRDRSLLDIDLEVWDQVLRINLTGCMLAARHAIPLMQKSGGGAMVHIASTQCLRGDPAPQDAYQVAKAGILALSKSIAVQFARDGIRSNVLLPNATESPMQARWEADPALKSRTAAAVPSAASAPPRTWRTPACSCFRTGRRSSPARSSWWMGEDWRCRDAAGAVLREAACPQRRRFSADLPARSWPVTKKCRDNAKLSPSYRLSLAVGAREKKVPDRVGGGADRQPEPDPARFLPALEADPGKAEQRREHAAIERFQPRMRLHGTNRSTALGSEPRR
jgi:NAD(P)-dependent dehydrogenase (short-subunit alcohol dehydrogenase family)